VRERKYHITVRLDNIAMKCLSRIMERKGVSRSEAIRLCIVYTYLSHIMLIKPEKEPDKAEDALFWTLVNEL